MSGSSRASRELSRCVATMDSGINISWETNPDGSYPGTEYHASEEAGFRTIIDAKTSAIEAIFDELQQAGWQFIPCSAPDFVDKGQYAVSHGIPIVELMLAPQPHRSEEELNLVVNRVARLLEQQPF